jgi:hypothetical protein
MVKSGTGRTGQLLSCPGKIAEPDVQPKAPPEASVECRVMLAAGTPAWPLEVGRGGGTLVSWGRRRSSSSSRRSGTRGYGERRSYRAVTGIQRKTLRRLHWRRCSCPGGRSGGKTPCPPAPTAYSSIRSTNPDRAGRRRRPAKGIKLRRRRRAFSVVGSVAVAAVIVVAASVSSAFHGFGPAEHRLTPSTVYVWFPSPPRGKSGGTVIPISTAANTPGKPIPVRCGFPDGIMITPWLHSHKS